MPRRAQYTEESRASRASNFGIIVRVWMVLSLIAGIGYAYYFIWGSFRPVEQFYYTQYLRSCWLTEMNLFDEEHKFYIYYLDIRESKKKKRGHIVCTDDHMVPVIDKQGNISVDSLGFPIMHLKEIPKYFEKNDFYLKEEKAKAAYAKDWFAKNFFPGRDGIEIIYPALWTTGLVFISGIIGTLWFGRWRQKQFLRGKFHRGTRLLPPWLYALTTRNDGIGIDVFSNGREYYVD